MTNTGKTILVFIFLLSFKAGYSQAFSGARHPSVTALERRLYPNLSTCGRCGRPWNCCEAHSVYYNPREGVFALCEDCWNECSIAERKKYYTRVYKEQVAQGMKDDHYKALMDSIEVGKSHLVFKL